MELWSYALTAVGIMGLWQSGSKNKFGWLIGAYAQVLWIIFAIATEQYGFIVSAFVYGYVYVRNYTKWVIDERRNSEGP